MVINKCSNHGVVRRFWRKPYIVQKKRRKAFPYAKGIWNTAWLLRGKINVRAMYGKNTKRFWISTYTTSYNGILSMVTC